MKVLSLSLAQVVASVLLCTLLMVKLKPLMSVRDLTIRYVTSLEYIDICHISNCIFQ